MKLLLIVFSVLIGTTSFSQEKPLFTLLNSEDTGLLFNNEIVDDLEKNILKYANFYGGAGVGIGDFNNDGFEDVYFAGNMVDDKLYFNQGNLKFKDVTDSNGIINDGTWSTSVVVADVNNDGHLDIYVTKELYDYQPELRKNKLYINKGNGTFDEKAEAYGVANSERTRHATFFDYNKDGFLDLFLLNQPPNPGSYSDFFGSNLKDIKYASRLFKNTNGTSFVDVSAISGIEKTSFPNSVSASDFNNDGWTDLYVSNDFYAPDYLYINNKNGTFTNVANQAMNHMSYFSMGVDVADIDNDNFMDLFVVDMVAEDNFRLKSNMSGMNPKSFWNVVNNGGHYQYMFNTLQINNGNQTFSDIAQFANVAATDWSWSNLIADFDNDGEKDIYVTNGLLRDIRNTDASKAVGDFVVESANTWVRENPNSGDVTLWDILDIDGALAILPSVKLPNYAYKNMGNFNFQKVSKDWGLDTESFSNGSAYADFDNDGDLDLIVNNINEEAFLYQNNTTQNFIRFELNSKEHKPTFGTRVTIQVNDKKQIIETTNVRGIYSTSEASVHFGVGAAQIIDEVTIKWPNQKITRLTNVKANQEIVVYLEDATENDLIVNEDNKFIKDKTFNGVLNHKHVENVFDDYKHQVLLPHKLSQFGPALAVSDVNGDQLDDVFIGASTGNEAALYIQSNNGTFDKSYQSSFFRDAVHEDVDALFFDVDKDGDNDLYVVSGGNEFEENDKNYSDRLYLNDGKGNFKKEKDNVLAENKISGSKVVAADFDNDGDLDVFVGGRLKPHQYPLPVSSALYENRRGKLVDVTNEKAIGLNNLGMVTDAIWSDFDNDQDQDLIVVGEWMKITIFENYKGKFKKLNVPDLENSSGWWFSIDQGDFDNDGDMDFIVGNLGLNYKYKASHNEPFDVYYKDFDENGKKDIVLGYYNYGVHYPLRGFSCSAQQVPELKQEIEKYDVFAGLGIEDVYGKENLEEALHYEVEMFESVYIENKENGRFEVSTLPNSVQFSSINDMIIDDLNQDGNLDAILVGNLYVSEIETPRNDAGTGVVLMGNGKGKFESKKFLDSGFFARGDAKKLKQLSDRKNSLILVGNNDDIIQVFEINQSNK